MIGHMGLIWDYILDMLPYMALALPLILLWRWAACRRLRRHGMESTTAHEVGTVLFFLFIVGLASQTVIPPLTFEGGRIRAVPWEGAGDVNLELGRVFRVTRWEVTVNGNRAYRLINSVGNIGMFVPIGFGTALLWRRGTLAKSALVGLGASLSIELLQLPLARATDVDDLWLNTLGAVLGWLLYRLLRVWLAEPFSRCRVRRGREEP